MSVMVLNAANEYQLGMSQMEAGLRTMTEDQIGRDLPKHCAEAMAAMNAKADAHDAEDRRCRRLMTAEGHAEHMGLFRNALRQELSGITGPLFAMMSARIESLTRRMITPSAKADRESVKIERRTLLRVIDPLEREQIYLEANRTGDEMTWACLEEAASFDPVRLRPEIIAEGRALRAEATYPEVVTAVRATEELRRMLKSAVRGFEVHCGLVGDVVDVTRQDDAA